jgi:tetratricopeptide (TPR) repeat protein
MAKTLKLAFALLAALAIMTRFGGGAAAASNPALNADILRLALDWEHIKFEVRNPDDQESQMAVLADHALQITKRYQSQPEAAIWLGIIVSEQASMASENGSPFKALGFAARARDILDPVEKSDPMACDAGAPTSLGVLFYRVPGFPISFGDTSKARQYLQKAIANAPNGMDANYFYGDFLYQQHEYAEAAKMLKHALALPAHRERPLWDKERRLVIQELLAKMQQATR